MKSLEYRKKNFRAMLTAFSDEQKEILAKFYCDYINLEDIEDTRVRVAAKLLDTIWDEEVALLLEKRHKYCSKVLYPFIRKLHPQYGKLNKAQKQYLSDIRDSEREYLDSMRKVAGNSLSMLKKYY